MLVSKKFQLVRFTISTDCLGFLRVATLFDFVDNVAPKNLVSVCISI